MIKALIRVLVIVGLIFFVIPSPVGKLIGILMIAGGLYLGLMPNGVLRKEEVIDKWAVLIGGGQGRAEEIFSNTENFLKQTEAPGVAMERKKLSPNVTGGFVGNTRDFEIITTAGNYKLSPYQMFIGARDYGNNLDVSWYLTFRPSTLLAILSVVPFLGGLSKTPADLDLFDEQDLRAYVTNAHHCLLEAVDRLMIDLNRDPSKIDRKSKGFLGIS